MKITTDVEISFYIPEHLLEPYLDITRQIYDAIPVIPSDPKKPEEEQEYEELSRNKIYWKRIIDAVSDKLSYTKIRPELIKRYREEQQLETERIRKAYRDQLEQQQSQSTQ
jgi:hypothetical protein